MANVTYAVNTTTRDMIFKQYTTMTVNSGDTLTTDSWCRGMFFYVQGDCTINGSIRMDATNASGNTGSTNIAPGFDPASTTSSSDSASVSADGLRLPMVTSGGSQTLAAADFAGCGTAVVNGVANQGAISGNGTIFQILRHGGAGGAESSHAGGFGSIGSGNAGTAGATGAAIISAGGGATGGKSCDGGSTRTSGAGGTGSCFGGGGSSGGSSGSSSGSSGAASWAHGAGGNTSGGGWWGQYSGHGGSGAGTIIIVVGGDLTIGASANITCNAGSGGSGQYGYVAGGGGGGGGVILILYAGTLSNSGTVTCNGAGGSSGGATGGAGGVHIAQVTY